MQENVRKHVRKAEEKRKKRRKKKLLVGICSILVAAGVIWGLILPGLAATGNGGTGKTVDGGTISERINLSVSKKNPDDGKNGQILYATVSATNSNPTDTELVPVRIRISELPEGITLTGFEESNVMQVTYKSSSDTTEETLEVKLVEENGETYIEFEPPAGSTVSFDLQFNSLNGIMEKDSKVTLTPEIPDQKDNDVISEPAELIWHGTNLWQDLKKTVSKEIIPVNGTTNKLEGTLDYRITANSMNPCGIGDTGAIWTDHVELSDVLTLPEGISFPDGSKVSNDGTSIVDKSGNVIFQFTDLQGGTVTSLSIQGKTVTYKISIPNQYMVDGVPTREQNHLNVSASLDVSKLVLVDNYIKVAAEKVKEDVITNHVDFEAFPYKEYDHTKLAADVKSRPELKEDFKIVKTADKKEVVAGDTINYTITVENTGNNLIKGEASDGTIYKVTDKLPDHLVLTAEQIQAIRNQGAEYDEETRMISWAPGTLKAGEKAEFTFAVNVKSQEELAKYPNNTSIHNKASYKGKSSTITVIYKKPELVIDKSSDKTSVKNGDLITYTVTIENKEDYETIEQILEDVLPKGLVFQYVIDKNGNQVTKKATDFMAESSNATGGCRLVGFQTEEKKLTFSLGRLKPNEKVTIRYVCKVDINELPEASDYQLINQITSNSSGESSGETVEVENPITVDKKVNGGEGGDTFKEEELFKYSITITNAEGDAAYKKGGLSLTDSMPYHVLPSEEYTIYKAKQAGALNSRYPKSDDELVETGMGWKEYTENTSDWSTYYTKINGEYVRVKRYWIGKSNGMNISAHKGIQLIWQIGTMEPGEVIEKEFNAYIYMDDKDNEQTGPFTYTNTATVNGMHDSVTVKGEPEGKQDLDQAADIQKSVWAILDQYHQWKTSELKNKYIFSKSVNEGNYLGNYVIYNVTVTNTGEDPLHIDTLEDHMPEGLEYVGIRGNLGSTLPVQIAKNYSEPIKSNDWNMADVTSIKAQDLVRDVTIAMTKDDKENHVVTFTIGDGEGYDLPAGKNLSFFVMCKVNKEVELDVPLTNTIDLPVDKNVEYRENTNDITMKGTRDDTRQNNGTSEDKGVTGGKRIISSSVTITPRDVIVPGITKKAESYIPSGKNVEDAVELGEKDNIQPNVTTKWLLELRNDGTIPICDYTIKDSVQTPFHILSKAEATNETLDLGLDKNAFVLTIYGDDDSVLHTYDLSEEVWKLIPDNITHEFSLHLEGTEYQIPAGGRAEFSVYTRNTVYENRIYENTAYLLPDDPFDDNSVRVGELVTDDSGKYIGVKASDCVYALGDYGSFSWKTIEETGNPDNRGSGYLGLEGKNYIYLDEDGKNVIYTNNIENVSNNSFTGMVIVDSMPHVNDTGVLNQKEMRGSEFSVAYAEGLELWVTEENGAKQQLEEGVDYFVECSNLVSFTEADMSGTSTEQWHSFWQPDDKSFRIKMADTFALKKGCILTVKYDGILGENARPGETAWNSFAYQYTAEVNGNEKTLRAEPPKVGVKIYKKPIIEKDVFDAYGNELPYDETKLFTFAIYRGDSTEEADYITDFCVCQGGSVALKTIVDTDGKQVFENGQMYTVKEKLVNGYELIGIGQKGTALSSDNKYTFTYYENLDNISIQVKNQEYGYELPATGGVGTTAYTTGGAAIMLLSSLLYGYRMRRKRERGAGI